MTNKFLLGLLAATALVPTSASAFEREPDGRPQRQQTISRSPAERPQPPAQRDSGQARPDRGQPQARPQFQPQQAQQQAQQQPAQAQANRQQFRQDRRQDGQDFRQDRRQDAQNFRQDRQDNRQAFQQNGRVDPQAFRQEQRGDAQNFRQDRRNDGQAFRQDRRDDRQDFNRDRRDDRNNNRGQGFGNGYRGNDAPRGYNGYDRRDDRGGWNRDWRRNSSYNWQNYRQYNRGLYRLDRYRVPYGYNYGYQRFSIGFTLNSLLFDQSYWIDDPYYYRLPEAYGPYRWVRYYDDALLVDLRTGYVVDVVYDIFW